MHSYLPAIGFSDITKEYFEELTYEAIKMPDSHEVCADSDGNEYVEIVMSVNSRAGIAFRGIYDEDDNFKMDYYYPYCMGETYSSSADLELIKLSDKECYQGLCDESRIGVNVIFFLQNMMEYWQKGEGKTYFEGDQFKNTYLTGLSLEGKILLPIATPVTVTSTREKIDRAQLLAAAREGDEDAIESLTLDDMDTYSMISKRVQKEDVYSIVNTTFMPYGIESDKYTVIGEILSVESMVNQVTMEELYLLELKCNDLEFAVCINKANLLGEPAVGRRFKGVVWMQGRVEF